jgi:hypothetical protein
MTMKTSDADSRPPLVSDSTIAEAAAMEQRDRAAGGSPWEVPDHPDNFLPGGWHHGQLTLGRDIREDPNYSEEG